MEDKNGNGALDIESISKLLGSVNSIALINLLKRLQKGKKLSAHEVGLLNKIEKQIGSEQEEAPQERTVNGAERLFNNPLEVLDYLKDEGWKVSKSSIYAHVKKGMLRPDAGQKFSTNAVLNYAKTHLVTEKTRQKLKAEELQSKKTEKELEKLEEEIKHKRFKRQIEEGKYIFKDDFYHELSARGVVLETDFKGMIQTRAGEFVELVEGNEKKTGDLVRELLSEVDRVLNTFATTKEFQVIFEVMEDAGSSSP